MTQRFQQLKKSKTFSEKQNRVGSTDSGEGWEEVEKEVERRREGGKEGGGRSEEVVTWPIHTI